MSKNDSEKSYTKPVTAYIEPDTLVAFEKKAEIEERTVSSLLRILIKRYLGENE